MGNEEESLNIKEDVTKLLCRIHQCIRNNDDEIEIKNTISNKIICRQFSLIRLAKFLYFVDDFEVQDYDASRPNLCMLGLAYHTTDADLRGYAFVYFERKRGVWRLLDICIPANDSDEMDDSIYSIFDDVMEPQNVLRSMIHKYRNTEEIKFEDYLLDDILIDTYLPTIRLGLWLSLLNDIEIRITSRLFCQTGDHCYLTVEDAKHRMDKLLFVFERNCITWKIKDISVDGVSIFRKNESDDDICQLAEG